MVTFDDIARVTMERAIPRLRAKMAEEIEVLSENPDLLDVDQADPDYEAKLKRFGDLVIAKRRANGTLDPLTERLTR